MIPYIRLYAYFCQAPVGIRQEKRASVIRARPAPISLLPLPCRAMPHNIRALTVGTMENLDDHDATRSRWGFSASPSFAARSSATPLEHLPRLVPSANYAATPWRAGG